MKRIAVIGAGRVGLVSAACLAHLGNQVTCIERNPFYLEILRSGCTPFFEPQLAQMVKATVASGALSFKSAIGEGIRGAGIIFLAVGTPQEPGGAVDLTDVLHAAEQIGRSLEPDVCIVSKSTVPPGTNDRLRRVVESEAPAGTRFAIVSNPEFLREGSAVADFLEPDRIVIGARSDEDAGVLKDLYAALRAPVVVTDVKTAELIKSVSNFYLALRISFANEVADFCDALNVDALTVLAAVGMDARIGSAYLQPGVGFGGPCLPKDLRGLADSAARAGVESPLIAAALRINDRRIEKALASLADALGGLRDKRICVLGLSFKAGTDDVRGAQSLRFIEALVEAGASVRAHDPIAAENFRRANPSSAVLCHSRIDDAVRGADAVAIMTAWPQYRDLSLPAIRAAMRADVFFDGVNLFEPAVATEAGLVYRGMGRVSAGSAAAAVAEPAPASA